MKFFFLQILWTFSTFSTFFKNIKSIIKCTDLSTLPIFTLKKFSWTFDDSNKILIVDYFYWSCGLIEIRNNWTQPNTNAFSKQHCVSIDSFFFDIAADLPSAHSLKICCYIFRNQMKTLPAVDISHIHFRCTRNIISFFFPTLQMKKLQVSVVCFVWSLFSLTSSLSSSSDSFDISPSRNPPFSKSTPEKDSSRVGSFPFGCPVAKFLMSMYASEYECKRDCHYTHTHTHTQKKKKKNGTFKKETHQRRTLSSCHRRSPQDDKGADTHWCAVPATNWQPSKMFTVCPD